MAKTLIYELYPIAWEQAAKQQANPRKLRYGAGKQYRSQDDPKKQESAEVTQGTSEQRRLRKTAQGEPEKRPRTNALKLMTEFLPRIKALNVDYIWLAPLYPSPRHDGGYDVSDYMEIDKRFGTLDDFSSFVHRAHSLGMKVLMDLVLNHTSTRHPWFLEHPEYYCWGRGNRPGWRNLFDGGSAWAYNGRRRMYYLHLFNKEQADLDWFYKDQINKELVREFREICEYWLKFRKVDGFRLDVPQAINKDVVAREFDFADVLYGERAMEAINAIFRGIDAPKTASGGKPFLLMECFDPSLSTLVARYARETAVDLVLNVEIKNSYRKHPEDITRDWAAAVNTPGFVLDLESHDSPRVASYLHCGKVVLSQMLNSGAEAICLYQGQELGLKNPTPDILTDEMMCRLDAQTAMRFAQGEAPEDIRPTSRANGRIALPLAEYERQEADSNSCLNFAREEIKKWKEA